jgi:hypothetical protein
MFEMTWWPGGCQVRSRELCREICPYGASGQREMYIRDNSGRLERF